MIHVSCSLSILVVFHNVRIANQSGWLAAWNRSESVNE